MRRASRARTLGLAIPLSAMAFTVGSYGHAKEAPVQRKSSLSPLLDHASVRQLPRARVTPRAASVPLATSLLTRPESGPSVTPLPPTPASKPIALRLPAFIALSVGGLGAGGAVWAGLAASAPYNDPKLACSGRCAGASRTLAVGSAVLGGVAVLGIGVGLGLLMRSSNAERPSLTPTLRLGLSPRKAAAMAMWRF